MVDHNAERCTPGDHSGTRDGGGDMLVRVLSTHRRSLPCVDSV